jgi:hypothetical protein
MTRFFTATDRLTPEVMSLSPGNVLGGGRSWVSPPILREVRRFDASHLSALMPLADFAKDTSKRTGRKGVCKRCDAIRVRAYLTEKRGPAPELYCSECGVLLEPPKRVICGSRRCRDARFRTNPSRMRRVRRRRLSGVVLVAATWRRNAEGKRQSRKRTPAASRKPTRNAVASQSRYAVLRRRVRVRPPLM